LRSDDGGVTWVSETSTPDLAGEAFFALAVDPRARDTVIAATSNGLYGRVPSTGGGFEWRQQRAGVFSSVIVAATATATRFICAQWTQDPTATPAGVFHSGDGGQTWTATGTGFPADAGRIALGIRADDPNTVYALVAAHGTGTLQGLFRLDAFAGNWKTVGALPDVLPVQNGQSQGDYDLAIAVDPADPALPLASCQVLSTLTLALLMSVPALAVKVAV